MVNYNENLTQKFLVIFEAQKNTQKLNGEFNPKIFGFLLSAKFHAETNGKFKPKNLFIF